MQKTATLNLRVDPDVKRSAEAVLSQLGLSMSTAVDMFLRQVALTNSIPFQVALPEAPRSIDVNAMSDEELGAALAHSLAQVRNGESFDIERTFSAIRKEFFDGR